MRKLGAWFVLSLALLASAILCSLAFGQTTYHVGKAFIGRALIEAKLVHLIHQDLQDAQSNIVDWKLRKEIRKTAVQLESAE